MEVSAFVEAAKAIESMGVIGILAFVCIFLGWLYFKEGRKNQEILTSISNKIEQLLDNQKENQQRFFDILLERESRFRKDS